MTREEIINDFTRNVKTFQRYARNIAGDQSDDLFQECTLMLLEFPEDRLISYWNDTQGLKPFFLRMLCNQFKSETSKYHKDYRKQEKFIQSKGKDITYNTTSEDLEAPVIDINSVRVVRDNLHTLNGEMFPSELEDMVFDLYVQTGSLRKALAAIPEEHQAKFDLKTVHTIVKKFRRTMKRHLNIAA